MVPFKLHRELGEGWLYVAEPAPDELAARALSLLGGHAANALYATVAQAVLGAGRDDPSELLDA